MSWTLDRHLYERIRPTTLKAAAPFTGYVVGLRSQQILTGRAEDRRRRRFAVRLVDRWLGIAERDHAGAAELGPGHRHRCVGRTFARIDLAVVGRPDGQRDWRADRRIECGANSVGWALQRRSCRLKPEYRWCVALSRVLERFDLIVPMETHRH